MITSNLVSAIIPTYNNAAFLPEAIDSVISQTYPNIEIIIVNDGSTDNTNEVLRKYLDRIIYIEQENAGPASARNTGIHQARGEYIAFLDADDIWMPTKIEEQLKIFSQNPNASLVYSRMVNFDDRSSKNLSVIPRKVFSGRIFDQLLVENLIALPTVIVRSNILDRIGLFDESLFTAEDWNLYLRIARDHEIIGVNKVLVRRRKHYDNISDRWDVRIGTLDSLDRIVDLFPDTAPEVCPEMKNAYLIRGKDLASLYFCESEYRKCHDTCCRLRRIGCVDSKLILYWLMTMWPPSVLYVLRVINRTFRGLARFSMNKYYGKSIAK